MFKGVTAWHRE